MIDKPNVFVVATTEISSIGDWVDFYNLSNHDQVVRMTSGLSAGLLTPIDFLVELAGRHCYRSWNQGRNNSKAYIGNILKLGHGSVLEHGSLTFVIGGVSRTLTHELVRHRVGTAFSQESQRYVDAVDIRFVKPPSFDEEQASLLEAHCEASRQLYISIQSSFDDTELGRKKRNEASRSVLPNASETRIVVTFNIRSLRHFLRLRGSSSADAEIQRLAIQMASLAVKYAPLCFQDMAVCEGGVSFTYST